MLLYIFLCVFKAEHSLYVVLSNIRCDVTTFANKFAVFANLR